MLEKLTDIWNVIHDAMNVDGGTWVDIFGVVIIARLLAVMKGMPALTPAEASIWAATITSLAYTNGKPK